MSSLHVSKMKKYMNFSENYCSTQPGKPEAFSIEIQTG